MSTILKLGTVDAGAIPADKGAFLAPYHASMTPALQKKHQFRDEADNVWRDFQPVPGTSVRDLQQFLKDSGFMPKALMDGVFGYATQAAVRLFQEYVRTIENDASIGKPDGVVGPNTLAHIEKWKREKAGKKNFVCAWGQSDAKHPSPEFRRWIALLKVAKRFFSKFPNPILQKTEAFEGPTATIRKVADWDISPGTIHLIGIRRAQEIGQEKRVNDDLFVLLIRGMLFKFWGSTDPNRAEADRNDIPFLVEGQHEYQFGWHKVGNSKRIYRALRPADAHGVLVFRDKNGDGALTDEDIAKGPERSVDINIHWSGIGRTNFSAGCQVIAGKSYINNEGQTVDCGPFAASSYDELAKGKTRGAYNVFADLVLSYAPPGVRTLRYLLGRDDVFENFKGWDERFVATAVEELRRGLV